MAKADRIQRLALSWISVILAAGFLAACAWDPPTIQRVPRETAAVDAKAKSAPAKKAAPKGGDAADFGDLEEEAALAPQDAAPPVDLTNFKERLVGLDSDEITDLMGAPDLERSEPPALIWQFRRPVCSVDVFMFDDGNGQAVDHVEVRGAQSDAVDEKQCFAAVLKNNGSAAVGTVKPQASQQVNPIASGGTAAAKAGAPAGTAAAARSTAASKAAASAGKASGGQKFAPKKPSAILDDPTGDEDPPPPPQAPAASSKATPAPSPAASSAAAAAAAAKGQARAKASSAAAPSPDGDLPTDLSE